MIDTILYYTAPSDESFEEMKNECISKWQTFDNEYGYADEKINRIKGITNVKDNFMYMLAMFDQNNQCDVIGKLSERTKQDVRERMESGGNEEYDIYSLGL